MSFDFTQLQANWNYPTNIRFGAGRVKQLTDICRSMEVSKPLFVTDQGLATLPMVSSIIEEVKQAGLSIGLFSQIKPNPTGENVGAGVEAYRQGGHDGVIAFGGGSALDAGKAIALMVGQSRPIWDFEDVGDNWLRVNEPGMAPCIAIPTTSGTGSEVGRASVITDDAAHIKRIIFHPKMLPSIVVLDPELTVGLPPNITAATGMDALSHCLEAYCSPGYHPMADGIAIEGMRLIKEWLPVAYLESANIEARSHMIVASAMGATAFQKGLGAMHALAHPLGAHFDAHHGLLNAILMPYVLTANQSVIADRMSYLATCLSLNNQSVTGVIDWIVALREELQIPHSLSEINIDASCLDVIAKKAEEDPSAGGNPIAFDAKAYKTICSHAIEGHVEV